MVNWAEHLRDGISAAVAASAAALVAAIGWLVRTVFTNQKQIALLQENLTARDEMRVEERKEIKADIEEVKSSVRRIEDVLIGGRK
jgi:hypothetical protein